MEEVGRGSDEAVPRTPNDTQVRQPFAPPITAVTMARSGMPASQLEWLYQKNQKPSPMAVGEGGAGGVMAGESLPWAGIPQGDGLGVERNRCPLLGRH